MTQVQLADRLGLHRVTLTKIETGHARVSRETLERLAVELGRSTAWLLGEPEEVDEIELARTKIFAAATDFLEAIQMLERRARGEGTESAHVENQA
jgi:transcriptional regulator with XRE-family HTH domain